MKFLYYLLVAVLLLLFMGIGSVSLVYATPEISEKTVRYINDRQVVRIRSGRTDKDRILTSVSSGTELELIAQKGRYSQVRTIKGVTGWLLSIYLRKTPIARVRLKETTKFLKQAKDEIKEKNNSYRNLNTIHEKLKERYQDLESNFTKSQQKNKKLAKLASEPIKLANENKHLSKLSAEMTEEINSLKAEMTELRDDSDKQWFLNGVGVILLGVLLGILLPKLRPQQKSTWSSY